jgi:hypothetical protein
MVAGLNLRVSIWRWTELPGSDDDVGGSVPSGTMVYQNVQGRRIDHLVHIRKIPILEADQQGLEAGKYNLFELQPAIMDVRENDEIQITNPPNNWDYLQYFRVISVMREGYHPNDRRGVLMCSTKRVVRAHGIQ